MHRLRQELRFALRGFRRAPGFFLTATVILGIGIGASVAMFTVFRTVLVRRLPVVEQDRVVVMWTYRDPTVEVVTGTKDLNVVRRESRTMRDIGAVAHWPATAAPFLDGDRTVVLGRAMSTGNFFDVLGARPALGRLLHANDDEPDGSSPDSTRAQSIVVSYRAWREKFRGDSTIVGRTLVEPLVRTRYKIVGVAPAGLDYPSGADCWIPMWSGWQSDVSVFAVARLAPGASIAAARDEYFAIENRLEPNLHLVGAHAATFAETVLGQVRPILALLTAAVALVLVVACLNVGNLLLLRASARSRDISIRRALGAAFSDIVRQLLVESAALAAAGGVVGLGIAVALLRLLVRFSPSNLPRLDDVQLAGAPIIAAAGVSAASVLIFGVGPAVLAGRTNLGSSLRADSRSGIDTRRRQRVRHALVMSQVALAMVMLGGAALLARSLERLEAQDAGYESDHLSILSYTWDIYRFDSAYKMVALADRIDRRLRLLPGVSSVSPLVVPPLLGNGIWQVRFDKEGQSNTEAYANPALPAEFPGPGFFKTFNIPVIRGREFTDEDREAGPLVAIVSSSAAERLWPNEDPIGQRIKLRGATPANFVGGDGWRTVVGVVRDANLRTIRESSPIVYLPSRQSYWQGSIAIRSTVPLSALLPALRNAGHDVDSRLELWDPRTMDQLLDQPLSQPRLLTLLMSGFGLVTLLLAAIGLYAVMSSLVRGQTREIGVRIALGATPGGMVAGILRRAAVVTGIGAGVGLLSALAISRVFAAMLFHVSPTDPLALGAACAVLLAVGGLAAYFPARRAAQVDPVQALRSD